MKHRPAPFTNFLLALAHSGLTTEGFTAGQTDEEIIDRWGITREQLGLLRDGTLAEIQAEVQREQGNTDAVVMAWIGSVPWPWIGTS